MLKLSTFLISALLLSVMLASLTTNSVDPLVGTWKLNVSKSKFNPAPGPTSTTVIEGEDRKLQIEREFADGKSVNWSIVLSKDGSSVPFSAAGENSTFSRKVIDQRHIEDHWNTPGGISVGRGAFSHDGKTLTYLLTGTDPQGKNPFRYLEVYEKQ